MSSSSQDTYYFGAGPATLPKEVLTNIQRELLDYRSTGLSILELSHRSDNFVEMLDQSERLLRELMNISNDYAVLFLHGGATTQYSMLPLNFLHKEDVANYVCTGHWSSKACEEAKQFASINEIHALDETEKISITPIENWSLNPNAVYLHYCDNETINGIAFPKALPLKGENIFCDMTSSILTHVINIQDYSLIYASAQKNLGVAGLCVMIMKKEILEKTNTDLPRVFDYRKCFANRSMVNTPAIFAIYVLGLMLDWLKANGGVKKNFQIRQNSAQKIYELIDASQLYENFVCKQNRSIVNIPFTIRNKTLEQDFLQYAKGNRLLGLQGHKSVGGLRISLYNAMPQQGVEKLIELMRDFECSHT